MKFNDLLIEQNIDASNKSVLVLRHKPNSKDTSEFRSNFASLVEDSPDLFNAYQSTQGESVEKKFKKALYVASFLGDVPRQALFIGVFRVGRSRQLTKKKFWSDAAFRELGRRGMNGFTGGRRNILKFDLRELSAFRHLKGKLIIDWPGERPVGGPCVGSLGRLSRFSHSCTSRRE